MPRVMKGTYQEKGHYKKMSRSSNEDEDIFGSVLSLKGATHLSWTGFKIKHLISLEFRDQRLRTSDEISWTEIPQNITSSEYLQLTTLK